VLIVDDQPAVCIALASFCDELALTYVVAGDGELALRAFVEHHPELVITDVQMPRLSGFQLIARIRALAPVPILVLSMLGQSQDVEQARRLGATAYLVKPVSLSAFRASVLAALGAGFRP